MQSEGGGEVNSRDNPLRPVFQKYIYSKYYLIFMCLPLTRVPSQCTCTCNHAVRCSTYHLSVVWRSGAHMGSHGIDFHTKRLFNYSNWSCFFNRSKFDLHVHVPSVRDSSLSSRLMT